MVESRMGAVAWAIRQRSVSHPRSSNPTCPIKASGSPVGFTEGHTASEPIARGICTVSNSPSSLDTATSDSSGLRRCCQAYRQSPRPPHLRKHIKSQVPLLRRHYPASTVVRPCPTPAKAAALKRRRGRYPRTGRVSPDYSNHLSDVPCPLPRRIERVSIASPLTRPSSNGRRVGIRIVTFAACSGFTHVTSRRIAQPPKAAFVTRLQPFRLPGRAARQLPDQSTTLWVESSSTGDPRLQGALPTADKTTAAKRDALGDELDGWRAEDTSFLHRRLQVF